VDRLAIHMTLPAALGRGTTGEESEMKTLQPPESHQVRIARDTLRMNDTMALVMGGPTKAEAREILARVAGWSARRIANFEAA
jgi:hypothetical protein